MLTRLVKNVWLWFHAFQLEILRLLVTRFTLDWIGLTPNKMFKLISKSPFVKYFRWKSIEKFCQCLKFIVMPCCPLSLHPKPLPQLFYTWSATWIQYPKNNLKLDHKCLEPVNKKNFVRLNKEAIASYRRVDSTRSLGKSSSVRSCMSMSNFSPD